MAILTEVPDSPPRPSNAPPRKSPSPTNPFHFWFHFTILASLITLLLITLSYFSPQDPKTWFLNLPSPLRQHYSKGRTIKVQIVNNQPHIEVFSIQEGPSRSPDKVLFIHGIGCSSFAFSNVLKTLGQKDVHAVAIDLPGSGFSDKCVTVIEETIVNSYGFLGRVWEIYEEIKEKGVFSGFDELIENGYVDLERKARVSRREKVQAIELGSEEMGKLVLQVIDAMRLAPVNLVLHDSALGLSANWILENKGLVRSVMILDGLPGRTALPLWVLELPAIREVVLGSRFVFEKVIGVCCVKSAGEVDVEAHRILLKSREGRRSVVGTGKRLNSSFDLAEWSGLDGVKGLPMQVMWSSGWSREWTEQGRRVADVLPQATYVTHSGGLWPQEHNAVEIADSIHQFVSTLPKSSKQAEQEAIPEHNTKMSGEVKISSQDHHHHHHHDGHNGHDDHVHAHAGYMDAYGLGHGWAT